MATEPDKKIEELLKAYAAKRQDEAGAPLELHPATRKLLQAEVARLRPKPALPSESWWRALSKFWPRLVFAASVLIALGVVFWR
jgi:hypothetical protein